MTDAKRKQLLRSAAANLYKAAQKLTEAGFVLGNGAEADSMVTGIAGEIDGEIERPVLKSAHDKENVPST